jgi:hypothetical protein
VDVPPTVESTTNTFSVPVTVAVPATASKKREKVVVQLFVDCLEVPGSCPTKHSRQPKRSLDALPGVSLTAGGVRPLLGSTLVSISRRQHRSVARGQQVTFMLGPNKLGRQAVTASVSVSATAQVTVVTRSSESAIFNFNLQRL